MNEDVFNGAMAGFVFFDGFYSEVVEEIGEEKTLSLMDKMGMSLGKMQGKMLKSQARRDKIRIVTPSIARSLIGSIFAGLGMETEIIKDTPEKISLDVKRCPAYEAGKLMGLADENLCRHSAVKFMDTVVKQLNPNLSYELKKFRTSSDDCCREVIVLKKELLIEN